MTSACSNGALTIRLRAPNQAANQQRTASKKATANRRQILFLAEHETIPITSTKPSANSSDDKPSLKCNQEDPYQQIPWY